MCLDNSPHSLSGLRPEKHRGRASPSSPPPSPLAQPRPLRYACTPGASMRLSSPHSTIPTRPACQSRCGKSSRKSAAVCLQAGPGTQICDASQRVATAAKNTFVCCAAPEAWDPPSIKQNRRAHLRRALGEVDWATAACRVGPRTSGSAGAGSRPPRTPTRPRPASRSPPAIATAGGCKALCHGDDESVKCFYPAIASQRPSSHFTPSLRGPLVRAEDNRPGHCLAGGDESGTRRQSAVG